MEHHQTGPSPFTSLRLLFKELERMISLEYQNSGTPWVSVERLRSIFYQEHQISFDSLAQDQGFRDDLKGLVKSNHHFSIYSTPDPQQFYVALRQDIVPHSQHPRKPIQHKAMKTWGIDPKSAKVVGDEGSKTTSLSSIPESSDDGQKILLNIDTTNIDTNDANPKTSNCDQKLKVDIDTIDGLELALINIIQELTKSNPESSVTVTSLSKTFYDIYGLPVHSKVSHVFPAMKLTEWLQTIPMLQIQENHNGHILIRCIGD